MTAAHCPTCDEYDCPGFATPRATPEPVPAVQPEQVATDADEHPRWVRSCRACGAAASTGNPRHYAMCAFTDGSAIR